MKKERILECTFNELAAHGIKHVSVDSIAAKLHVSKKTIYDFFENKENLLLSALKHKTGAVIESISLSANEADENILCRMIAHAVLLFKFMSSVSPVFFEEMELWPAAKEYSDGVKKHLLDNGRKRFAEGIKEGYLREDADFDIVGRLLEAQIRTMVQEAESKYTPIQICFYSLIIILRGVCTESGIKVLDAAVERGRNMKGWNM